MFWPRSRLDGAMRGRSVPTDERRASRCVRRTWRRLGAMNCSMKMASWWLSALGTPSLLWLVRWRVGHALGRSAAVRLMVSTRPPMSRRCLSPSVGGGTLVRGSTVRLAFRSVPKLARRRRSRCARFAVRLRTCRALAKRRSLRLRNPATVLGLGMC